LKVPRNLLAIPLLLASLQLQASVLAQEDQSSRWLQVGQFRGLLDATCFYYKLGHLDDKAAMAYLRELQASINSSFANGKLFNVLKDQVLREFPDCRQVWPE